MVEMWARGLLLVMRRVSMVASVVVKLVLILLLVVRFPVADVWGAKGAGRAEVVVGL